LQLSVPCVAKDVRDLDKLMLLQESVQLHTKQQPEFLQNAAAEPLILSPSVFNLAIVSKGRDELKLAADAMQSFASRLWSRSVADEKNAQIQPIQEIVLSKVDLAPKKKLRVAVFAQAANMLLMPELQDCITHVGRAQANIGSTVDVYLSTPLVDPGEVPGITESVKEATPALGFLEVQVTENRGADVGQFLQQMRSASLREYDAILKIHTKTYTDIRQSVLQSLCGSAETAQRIIASFAANSALGLAGPDGWVAWRGLPAGSPRFGGNLFSNSEVNNMVRIWSLITGAPFPEEEAWAAAVTNFFWARGSRVTSNPELLRAVPRILSHMSWGYFTGSVGQPEHALERLIGTMVRWNDGVVARIVP